MKLLLGAWLAVFIILCILIKVVPAHSIYEDEETDHTPDTSVIDNGNLEKGNYQDSLDAVYPVLPPDTSSFIHFKN
jgi:hypothetical protein